MFKTYFSLSVLVFFSFSLFAQAHRPIPQHIEKLHQILPFQSYEVFSLKNEIEIDDLSEIAEDAKVFQLETSGLHQILNEKPKTIQLSIPLKNEVIEVELYQKNIFTDNFRVFDQNHQALNYQPGVYYRGIVKNNPNSIVAFSFFRNDVTGVISIGGQPGNIVIGKLKNSDNFVSYSDYLLNKENPFSCETEVLPASPETYSDTFAKPTTDEDWNPCVRIYYEITNSVYLEHNENVDQTINWMTAVHNNINTLYENDEINISLHNIMIWMEEDPYPGDPYDDLDMFLDIRQDFEGDLGHLVSTPSTTSLAFLDSICQYYNHAYSGISLYFGNVPTYSWTIMAMTHETGHALGSPHTHSCSWNGNNTAIDICAPTFDPEYSEGCNDGPIPYDEGGTIMSYCHLLGSVGINFNNGFGEQPANLIRNNMMTKFCLGTNCTDNYDDETHCFPSVSYNIEPITYVGLHEIDNESSVYSSIAYEDFTEISTELARGETYEMSFKGFTGGNFTNYFTVFIDFNEDGQFDSEEEAFFTEEGNYVSITNSNGTDDVMATGFIHIPVETELGQKRMRVIKNYDQPILNACDAVSYGQIEDYTIEVVKEMSVEDQVFSEFTFYPNPVKEFLQLQSDYQIEKVQILNLLGQEVMQSQPKNLSAQIQVESLSAGIYFMKVNLEGKTKTYKLIKK